MALPVIGALLAGASTTIAMFLVPKIVKWVLIALGMSIVTFLGVDTLQAYILSEIYARWSGLPADLGSYLEYCGALAALNIVISSAIASLTLKFALGGKKLAFN